MNDKEKISRLIGAAISECSGSKLDEVKSALLRAMKKLGDVREEKSPAKPQVADTSFVGMTREQRDAAVRAIDEMIEDERSRTSGEGDGLYLMG